MIERSKKKYELIEGFDGLHRIRALRDFGEVKAGDLGGYVESEVNLSHDGDAWIADEAMVMSNAIVSDNALVKNFAMVSGDAKISGEARVTGWAIIGGRTQISGNAYITSERPAKGKPVFRGPAASPETRL